MHREERARVSFENDAVAMVWIDRAFLGEWEARMSVQITSIFSTYTTYSLSQVHESRVL